MLGHNITVAELEFRFCAKCHATFEVGQGDTRRRKSRGSGFLFVLDPEGSVPID